MEPWALRKDETRGIQLANRPCLSSPLPLPGGGRSPGLAYTVPSVRSSDWLIDHTCQVADKSNWKLGGEVLLMHIWVFIKLCQVTAAAQSEPQASTKALCAVDGILFHCP